MIDSKTQVFGSINKR